MVFLYETLSFELFVLCQISHEKKTVKIKFKKIVFVNQVKI